MGGQLVSREFDADGGLCVNWVKETPRSDADVWFARGKHCRFLYHVEEILCRNQRAPVDDAVAWGESLDHLLECKTGQLVFEDFLKTEYSEENLLFWLACEDYKKITSETEMTAAAKRIYAEFVQVDAPRQINIDCVTRGEISENLSQPGPNCFDRAQKLIYGLMENDCYPRFLKSEIYQALLEQQ